MRKSGPQAVSLSAGVARTGASAETAPVSRGRREDHRLITGAGCFTDDVPLDDPLFVTFVRSTVARGRITAVDAADALGQPGVVAVFTGADTADLGDLAVNAVLRDCSVPPFPVLAERDINAVGQPVAAVISTTRAMGQDAADSVVVEAEDLDAVASINGSRDGQQIHAAVPDNVAVAQSWQSGDAASRFASAAFVVEASVSHPRLAPASMEPRAIAVEHHAGEDGLTVWLSTQTPHRSRSQLASILGIAEDRVRLIAPDVGGAFGMKASLYPEEVFVAWAALRLKRSLRWTATRSEEFLSATHGRGAVTKGRLAVSEDGGFLALDAEVTCPLGHWLPSSAAIPAWNAARILPGPYDIGAVDIRTRGTVTNSGPVGIYRGAGRPEAAALMERLVDRAACVTGLDPVEIRRRNLLKADQMPHEGPTGTVLDSGRYGEALARLCAAADYGGMRRMVDERRRGGEVVGVGLAFYVEPCGQGWESATVTWKPDGTVEAATGGSTQGHGRETAFAGIVADVFAVDPAMITLRVGDTATCPNGIGALASRSTAIGGSALRTAALKVKRRVDGAGSATEPVTETIRYEAEGEAWGYGCCLAAVSIDRDTGVPAIENMTCLDDIGNVIDARMVEGQILGGVAQGIGEALMESIVYDESGQLITGSFLDYAMPRATDIPEISIDTMCTPSPFNALGAKGIGEAGTIGAPAAILNAVLDALGPFGVTELPMPLTSERLWQAMQNEN